MNAVSVAVLAYIFVPLVGGPIRAYEIDEVRSFFAGEPASTQSTAIAERAPDLEQRRLERSSAEVQEVALTDDALAELSTLEMPAETESATLAIEEEMLGGDDDEADEADVLEPLEALEELDVPEQSDEPVEPNA